MLITRVTLLGNKDHGKSTLIGSMLMLTKSVTKERIAEAERTSKALGRKFEPGFILDSFSEEREGGLTIDTTRVQVKHKGAAFELIDVPGHEELIQNMISGASYAGFAILIISAMENEGITQQTKRHLFLAKMLGVTRVIIAVNKMDAIGYSRKAFDDIKEEMLRFLGRIGFDRDSVSFIPVSAYNYDNILARSKRMPWYTGEPLMQSMLQFSKQREKDGKSLRISVQGSIESGNGTLVTGKVISGKVSKGDTVASFPEGRSFRIESIYVKGRQKPSAGKGDDIAIKPGSGPVSRRGSIICSGRQKPLVSDRLSGTVFFVREPAGKASIRYNGIELAADIIVHKVIDIATGGSLQKNSEIVLNAAKASITSRKKFAFEKFNEYPELGRFTLYSNGTFAGIGIID